MHEKHRQRLRKRLCESKNSLEEHELLEMLLFYALPRVNTNPIAHRLLESFSSIDQVLKADPKLLMQVEGVGESTATYLSLLGEIFSKHITKQDLPVIFSFEQIREPIIKMFSGMKEEVFVAFFLDQKQRIIAKRVICDHSPNKVSVDLSDFSKHVIALSPKFVVIAHNHLSGICEPTAIDDETTERLCLILRLYNVNLADHLIVAGDNVFSYYYQNRIDDIKNKVEKLI